MFSKGACGMLAGVAALAAFALAQPASALTMKQCSEKYKSASDAGAVGSATWNDFRKAECGEGATMALKKVKAEKIKAEKVKTEKVKTGTSMHECSMSFKAAKAAGTLGGMTWNEFREAGCVAKTAATPPPAAKKEAAAARQEATTKVTEKECSARYQSAKTAGTLGAMTWNEFRSAGCPTTMARNNGSMLPTMGSIFPASIAKKYAGQKAGRARMLTCRDQYEANKAAGITAPKWTEVGGGYYSECNKRLSQH
jgi:hypothetical protein